MRSKVGAAVLHLPQDESGCRHTVIHYRSPVCLILPRSAARREINFSRLAREGKAAPWVNRPDALPHRDRCPLGMALAWRTGPSFTHPDDSAALAHKMMSGLP